MKRFWILTSLLLPLACGSDDSSISPVPQPDAGFDSAPCTACNADSGRDAAIACADLSGADGQPGKSSLYPDARTSVLGAHVARVKTACVDTSALPAHARLDALVAGALDEAGLKSAPLGDCSCEWTIRFGSAPTLTDAAQATFTAGKSNAELYSVVTTATGGRPTTSLYATTERAGLYALRGALATATSTADGAQVPTATIVDWPEITARGFIDGIYGKLGNYPGGFASWPSKYTPATRVEILRLMSRLRGNTFIYGPKCDDYSRGGTCGEPGNPNWSSTYPKGNGQQSSIQTLAIAADEEMVDLFWAINPVVAFDWANPNVGAIKTKIDQLRALGVHHFAMFVDDSAAPAGHKAKTPR